MDSLSRSISHAPFTLRASDGETLYCDARFPADAKGPLPIVIFVHGFKGFKDWGSIPYICESIAGQGFYALSFNFSHNGVEGHSMEFTRLDKFAANTFSREVRELHEVIDAVTAGETPRAELADRERIGTVGHSRGGGITLLEASRDPRVRATAVWASVADFNRYPEAQRRRWRENGHFETKNMRTGQIMRLNVTLLDDLENNPEALDIGRAAASLGRPLLILHGEQDLSVRIEDGETLAGLADPASTEFVPIPRTNHTFGAVHPFQGTNDTLEGAIERTATFFRKHL
jgi:dipeptidyl aminopeptidase/acylaminoacyl peptidase